MQVNNIGDVVTALKTPVHRFHEIDLLRGLSCAAVVIFHYFSHGPRTGWMSNAYYPALDSMARYGYLGVHLFFIISGFVILMSADRERPRDFVASRVARLYPALWTAATITAITAWLLSDQRFATSLSEYLVNMTMVPHWFGVRYVDGAYWSLGIELNFYIYVWIALRLKQMHRLDWLLVAWLAVSALNAFRPAWPVERWLNAAWAPFFVAGGAFFLVRTRGATRLRGALLFFSWLLAMHYAARNLAPDSAVDPLFVKAVITVFFAIFLTISFDLWRMNSSRLTKISGTLTYPVFLIHQFFGYMVYERIRAVVGSTPIALGITGLLVVLMAWAIHCCIERTTGPKLRKWVSGRSGGSASVRVNES